MDIELKEMVITYLKDMDNRGDHEARDLLKLIDTPAQDPEEKTLALAVGAGLAAMIPEPQPVKVNPKPDQPSRCHLSG